jgi:dGTPase
VWHGEQPRTEDERDEYQRDKARIIHSAGFRRLQGKTQVMGVGEGDFHRTRLTHSIEVGQVGEGILLQLKAKYAKNDAVSAWLPSRDLVLAASYAHDLGHPPFGHSGEAGLHVAMTKHGGFEGNGQTLRILTRLEKYRHREGINPTRRLVLAVLKYPKAYGTFSQRLRRRKKPPKCYLGTESPLVRWALGEPFSRRERLEFTTDMAGDKPKHRSLDCSLMERADDVAYATHDLEDIVARRLVREEEFMRELEAVTKSCDMRRWPRDKRVSVDDFRKRLFREGSAARKQLIGHLVNVFITSAEVVEEDGFDHPLLRYRVHLPVEVEKFLVGLRDVTYKLVIERAEVQHFERRGHLIVTQLFEALSSDPERLVPKEAWDWLDERDSKARRVCDYLAGMTDRFAEKVYQRLFVPGFGSSRDEL